MTYEARRTGGESLPDRPRTRQKLILLQ